MGGGSTSVLRNGREFAADRRTRNGEKPRCTGVREQKLATALRTAVPAPRTLPSSSSFLPIAIYNEEPAALHRPRALAGFQLIETPRKGAKNAVRTTATSDGRWSKCQKPNEQPFKARRRLPPESAAPQKSLVNPAKTRKNKRNETKATMTSEQLASRTRGVSNGR